MEPLMAGPGVHAATEEACAAVDRIDLEELEKPFAADRAAVGTPEHPRAA